MHDRRQHDPGDRFRRRGIGRAIALRLARDGYDVVVHCRSRVDEAEAVAAAVRDLGRAARVLQFDVADRAEAARVLLADIDTHGCHYGIVCNAGISRDNAFSAMPAEDWDAVVHTNLDAFYNVLHPLTMPLVRRRAGPHRHLVVGVGAGRQSRPGQYSAAKAGIIGATKALAVELASRAITVNCVAPGLDRDRHGRRPRPRTRAGDDPGQATRPTRRGRGGSQLPGRRGCGLHYAPGDFG